jgi:hypothetical protein
MIGAHIGMWVLAFLPQASATGQTGYVPFCEIVRNPERYDQKLVTTSGIFRTSASARQA